MALQHGHILKKCVQRLRTLYRQAPNAAHSEKVWFLKTLCGRRQARKFARGLPDMPDSWSPSRSAPTPTSDSKTGASSSSGAEELLRDLGDCGFFKGFPRLAWGFDAKLARRTAR